MPPSSAPTGAVLVTGASSGIGKACAARLVGAGFHVLAGVRTSDDARHLDDIRHDRLVPVVLDVTDPESIAGAVRDVRASSAAARLVGLVNNAGIGVACPVEELPIDELRRQYEVNVFGLVAVTQAFLPMLRESRGRIVNIGSIGARITMPFAGALCSSKAAVRSLSDALRQELRPWGIDVVLVEPASIRTPAIEAIEGAIEPTVASFGPEGRDHYASTYRTAISTAMRHERKGSNPDVVAEVVTTALTTARPKTRYTVGTDARKLSLVARLPDPALDRIRARVLGIAGVGRGGRA